MPHNLFFLNLACKSHVKNLSVRLVTLNSSQNFYCFLPLAPIPLLSLAVSLVPCFVTCWGFLGDVSYCHLILAFEVHTLDVIKTQTSQCFGSRAHWIELESSKTWTPLLSPDQAHPAAVDKSYLCIFNINFQTFFRLRSFIPMCVCRICYNMAFISVEFTDV